MRPSPIALALSLLTLAAPLDAQARKAPASRWTEIGKTSTGNAVFVEPEG